MDIEEYVMGIRRDYKLLLNRKTLNIFVDYTIDMQFDEFMNEKVYDMVIKSASDRGDLDKSTVNNMLELFQGNARASTLMLMLYIKRQEKRGEIPPQVSANLLRDLKSIYDSFSSDEEKLSKAVYKYLLLFKWAFECDIRGVDTFNGFIENVLRGRS